MIVVLLAGAALGLVIGGSLWLAYAYNEYRQYRKEHTNG